MSRGRVSPAPSAAAHRAWQAAPALEKQVTGAIICTWQSTPNCTLKGTAGPGSATVFIGQLIWRRSAARSARPRPTSPAAEEARTGQGQGQALLQGTHLPASSRATRHGRWVSGFKERLSRRRSRTCAVSSPPPALPPPSRCRRNNYSPGPPKRRPMSYSPETTKLYLMWPKTRSRCC